MRRRFSSLRFRIASSYVLGALIVSGVVAGSTYALARTYLTRQRTDAAITQSLDGLRAAREYVVRPQSQRDATSLVTQLGGRPNAEVLIMDGTRSVTSSVSVVTEILPVNLVQAVVSEQVGWTVSDGPPRRFFFGAPVPLSELDIFFVYSLNDVDATLWTLARILLVVVGGTAVVSAVLGARLARRTIEPLTRASDAARLVAAGTLDTRLTESGDELGQMAASFNSMTRALQARIDRERRFVADASHELRTPLTVLKTSVDHLDSHADQMDEKLRPAARLASEEVQSLQRLVVDLLELTRAEAGEEVAQYSEVDLGAFALEVVRRRVPNSEIELVLPIEPVIVMTDKLRLERVVGNLVENAVSHGGPPIRLELLDAPTPQLIVSDAGPGIAPGDLKRIFDRFWRADTSRGRAGSGAGLGLAIAKENTAIIGGELTVTSQPGNGTTFTLKIPRGPVVH